MPRPAEDETGVPSVYRPEGGPAPVYEEYRDPASAHGWLNAYDETRELPRVASAAPGPGRAERRRAARGAGGLRAKHVAVAVGAVGAASVAALVAGFAFSSSSGGGQVEQDRAKHTAGESSALAQAPEESPSGASAAPSVKSAAPVGESPSARATSTAGTPASASETLSASATPTRSAGASVTPSPTAAATSSTASPTYGGARLGTRAPARRRPGALWGEPRGQGGALRAHRRRLRGNPPTPFLKQLLARAATCVENVHVKNSGWPEDLRSPRRTEGTPT